MNSVKKHHLLLGFLVLIFILMAACTGTVMQNEATNDSIPQPLQESTQTYVYECSGDYHFTARIEGVKAWLFLPFQTISVAQSPSASGVKFSDGSITFWRKGDEAMLDRGAGNYHSCKNNRARAIWEDAKLRGVDFRAVGNEPGWHLEINEKEKIVFVNNYGENRFEFAAPEPLIHEISRTTRYEVKDDKHKLTITLKGKRCRDTMSDESYETSVTLIFDGIKLSGCGKALH